MLNELTRRERLTERKKTAFVLQFCWTVRVKLLLIKLIVEKLKNLISGFVRVVMKRKSIFFS